MITKENATVPERRFKVLYVEPSVIINWFSVAAGNWRDGSLILPNINLPEGTKVHWSFHDPMRGSLAIVLWNEAWPIVPHEEYLPTLEYMNIMVTKKCQCGHEHGGYISCPEAHCPCEEFH